MKDFYFKKKYGQNFLKDNSVPQKMVTFLDVTENDLIIEIGPGKGILTKELKKLPSKLICYEIDLDTKEFLDKLEDDKTHILYQDFLQADFKEYHNKYENIYLVANIPYNITTPIIEKIIKSKLLPKYMLLMVQKEVADRFSAKPNSSAYGALTVYINYYYQVDKLFDVSRNMFYPKPNVDSSVIEFKLNEQEYLVNEEKLFKLIKKSFVHKRKTIRNNLYDYDLEKVSEILKKHNKDLSNRAEELDLETFVDLANNIK